MARHQRVRIQGMVAVTAALAVVATTAGCGVRVSKTLRQQAASAQLGTGRSSSGGQGIAAGDQNGATVTTPSGEVVVAGGDPSGNPTANSPTGAGNAPTNDQTGNGPGATTPSGPASTLPPGGNGGATDVGVTATTITLGSVSDLSGPVPGLFQGAVTGTLAYANYVNNQGGVFGRTLKITVADSQTACAPAQAAYNQLVGKVFAFVGGFSLYDDCSAQVLGAHKDIPAVQYALAKAAVELPNNFSIDPIPPGGYTNGPMLYFAQKLGDKVKKVGTLYPNLPSVQATEVGFEKAAASAGWSYAYKRAVAATETNFTTDMIRMKQAGVQVFFLPAENAQLSATMVTEALQQNFHPTFIIPVAYADNFVKLVGGAANAEGILGYQLYSMFFNPEDAASIPDVGLFQQWMKKTNAGQAVDLEAMYGWASGMLFTQALKAAGPQAKRATAMSALQQIHSFDAGGMVGKADPAGKKPTTCYVLWTIQGGKFVRTDTPAGGYRCDGQFIGP